VFAPWLTTLIDRGTSMRFVGVYRTDSTEWLCVRHSEWIREADLKRARRAPDLRAYLASGSQITDSFVFAQDRPELVVATRRLLAALAKGITVAATGPRQVTWREVSVEVADDGFVTGVEYSPLTARSDVLESGLAPWLEVAEDAVAQGGIRPDGEITLSIRRSIAEIVGAPLRAARS
jgi:hypothetical protein